jgi:AcrR family transcriptional regulator
MARTRTSERERDETKARILAAAYSIFAERGYRAATVDSIARASGLTRAGVLHHFSGKQELLLALLDARDEELGILRSRDGNDRSATTRLLNVRSTVGSILAQRELVALAHALSAEATDAEHPAHDWLTRRYNRLRASLTEAFTVSFERGELVPREDPALLAALSLAAAEGLEAQWLAEPAAVDVAQGIELLNSLILDRLRPHPPADESPPTKA